MKSWQVPSTKTTSNSSGEYDIDLEAALANQGGSAGVSYLYVRVALALAVVLGVWILIGAGNPFAGSAQGISGVSLGVSYSGSGPRPRQPAPPLVGITLDGKEMSLQELKGKVVVVNFFATWCGPCRAEMPDLDAVALEYRDRGLTVVAVNLQEEHERVKAYADILGLSFPILLDPNSEMTSRYKVTALPSTFFVDREGVVQNINIGPLTKKGFVAKVGGLLEGG